MPSSAVTDTAVGGHRDDLVGERAAILRGEPPVRVSEAGVLVEPGPRKPTSRRSLRGDALVEREVFVALRHLRSVGIPVARADPMGTRLITSTPPATTTSCWPLMTACAAKSSACWLDPQARFTVVPGIDSGQPAASTANRPMLLDWSPTWGHAAPHHVVDGRGSSPVRSTRAFQHHRREVRGVAPRTNRRCACRPVCAPLRR